MNVLNKLLPLALSVFSPALVADIEFGDDVPREVVEQLVGNQFDGETKLYSDIFAAVPAFTLPAGFEVLASADPPPPEEPESLLGEDESSEELGSVAVEPESSPHAASRGSPTATAADPDRARRRLIAVMGPDSSQRTCEETVTRTSSQPSCVPPPSSPEPSSQPRRPRPSPSGCCAGPPSGR